MASQEGKPPVTGEGKPGFTVGKQKYTKEEIIDILKRNMALYREDEKFVQYIVDLATYLVEYRLVVMDKRPAPPAPIKAGGGPHTRQWLTRTRAGDQELHRALKKHATKLAENATCRMCGSPCTDRSVCPHCGNMTF